MSALEDLPDSWERWSTEDDGRTVLVFRPDVFDGTAFDPACLPTIYVTPGTRSRQPGVNPLDRTAASRWIVTFYLEPSVTMDSPEHFEEHEAAVERAIELAGQFEAGELDPREAYQVPRDRYLDRLEELTAESTIDPSSGD